MTNEEFFDIGRVAYITGNVQEALSAKQALELVVENANSLQQLKAAIADLAERAVSIARSYGDSSPAVEDVVRELRQLSAV
jgi:hypothetical protein